MPDSVTFTLLGVPASMAELKATEVRMRRATMWGLRETGRVARKAMRSKAPVLTGALKKSIVASRKITEAGPEMSMTISVVGDARLYAAKEDALTGFADVGRNAGDAAADAVFASAWDRVARTAKL